MFSSPIRAFFWIYYFIFIFYPFLYGLFLSDFALHLNLINPQWPETRFSNNVGWEALVLIGFGIGLIAIYRIERAKFPNKTKDACKLIGYAALSVLAYVFILGPDNTLESFALFATVEVNAVTFAKIWNVLRNSTFSASSSHTYVGQSSGRSVINMIILLLFLVAYTISIFIKHQPMVSTALLIILITYSLVIFGLKVRQASRALVLMDR